MTKRIARELRALLARDLFTLHLPPSGTFRVVSIFFGFVELSFSPVEPLYFLTFSATVFVLYHLSSSSVSYFRLYFRFCIVVSPFFRIVVGHLVFSEFVL